MIVSINQPAYFPWLGYFERIARSDVHVVLDTVQFEKNSFTNRNRIRTKDGWCWLTVPVRTKGRFGARIDELEVADNSDWQRSHFTTLTHNYRRAPYFGNHAPWLQKVIGSPRPLFKDLVADATTHLLEELEITTTIVSSASLSATGRKDELVLAICEELGASTYLSGALGRDYLRPDVFESRGINVEFQAYDHPTYPQVHPGFVPNLSTVDLLLNCGPASRNILMGDKAS